MTPFVVFNPGAGGAVPIRRLRSLLSRLPGHAFVSTRGPGEAGWLAGRAADAGHDPIVVAGGDGLFAEVVNGLGAEPGRVRLGLLPMGTGNDLARGLGISRNPAAALETILAGSVRTVDAARMETTGMEAPGEPPARWFANAVVTGLAGRVAARARGGRKRRWGRLAYRVAALPELLRPRPVETELAIEGAGATERLTLSAHAVAVSNGPFAGGGIRIAPAARIDDGWLDLVVVPGIGRRPLSIAVLRLLAGADDGGRLLRRRARRVRLATRDGAWLNADGEPVPGDEAEIRIVPGALRVLAPPGRGGS